MLIRQGFGKLIYFFSFIFIVVSDFVFMSFFFVEMCFKLFALTPREYFSSKFNTFDFIVSYCLFCFVCAAMSVCYVLILTGTEGKSFHWRCFCSYALLRETVVRAHSLIEFYNSILILENLKKCKIKSN